MASLYAKRLAAEMGIQLEAVGTASGHKGRIIAADVLKASQEKPVSASKPATPSKIATPAKPVTLSGDRTYEDVPVSAMREIIGKRLRYSMEEHVVQRLHCVCNMQWEYVYFAALLCDDGERDGQPDPNEGFSHFETWTLLNLSWNTRRAPNRIFTAFIDTNYHRDSRSMRTKHRSWLQWEGLMSFWTESVDRISN